MKTDLSLSYLDSLFVPTQLLWIIHHKIFVFIFRQSVFGPKERTVQLAPGQGFGRIECAELHVVRER